MSDGTAADGRRSARDADLAARAAWLHFVGGLTQSDVAKRLNVPVTRAHRYIAKAQSDGLVRVFVDVDNADCVALENALVARYGLRLCRVAMDTPEVGPLPLRALGVIGADVLMQTVAARTHAVIGVGNGRTLAAAVDAMGRIDGRGAKFVSVLGGLTRTGAANPYDVIHRLAQKTGADAYLLPAPMFADTADARRVLMAQAALATTMELIEAASLVVLGIGDVDPAGGTGAASALAGDFASVVARGAVAEMLGQFLDADGAAVPTELDERVVAMALSLLRRREVIAIAGGLRKTNAVRAALASGLLTGLIIDEATARSLVETPT